MSAQDSIRRFFFYTGLIGVLSAFHTDLNGKSLITIIHTFSLTFAFNLLAGFPGGISWMFGIDIYLLIKKKSYE